MKLKIHRKTISFKKVVIQTGLWGRRVDDGTLCNTHRGYAVVCLSPVIEAVGVTIIPLITFTLNDCNSGRPDHRTQKKSAA